MTTDRKRQSDAGFISVELMVAVLLSIVFFVFLCNFIFVQYGKGVLRAAADEGARAGSRVDASVQVCEARAQSVLDNLGAMASNPSIVCTIDAGAQRIISTVSADFQPWMPWVPVISQSAVGSSVKEAIPE